MKNVLVLFAFAILTSFAASAVDRIVADGGAGGAFPTITDAINAASTNDRIIIYPKLGGVAYGENLIITNKSLQLLSATEGQRWTLNGNITFNPTVVGQTLTIIEANILTGNISTTANAPAGNRAKVRILNCKLQNGSIGFDFNNYDVNISRDSLMEGTIVMRFGKITGSYISYTAINSFTPVITINTDASASNDSLYIVGNKIKIGGYAYYYYANIAAITWNSTSQFYFISNNYILNEASYYYGILIFTNASSATAQNQVVNNTIFQPGDKFAIWLGAHNSNNVVLNNAITSSYYGIGSSILSTMNLVSFNHLNQPDNGYALQNILQDGTNVFSSGFTHNTSSGQVLTGVAINGGYPDAAYYDLDLTINDAGCFGGSYSRANFLTPANGAVASFMIAPRRVLSGQTITITGEGYDK